MRILIGERIILRDYRKEDLSYMRKWVNEYEITKYLSNVFLYPHSITDTENFLEFMLKGSPNTRGFVIAHKGTQEYIGQLDLLKIDWPNRNASIGITIGTKENLGKGYGTEAIQILQEFAFNRLNLNKLELEVMDYNQRAISCYKKCGFIEEGRIRESHFINGKYTDRIFMGVLKREWEDL